VLDRRPFLAAGHSNIPAERLARFAVVEVDAAGYLRSLLEKPDPILYASLPEPVYLSINAWRMPPSIFEACRTISPSPRGELELPDAVLRAVRQFGERFRVLPTAAPVLDLTGRDDVPEVEARLAAEEALG
jgi:glucose-1-phosphate thymidylyltransferase